MVLRLLVMAALLQACAPTIPSLLEQRHYSEALCAAAYYSDEPEQDRALVVDANSRMQIPGVPVRVNHGGTTVGVGFVDGHANSFSTPNDEMTVRPQDAPVLLDRLDEILDYADCLAQ